MNDDFYADSNQLRRELQGRWHRLGRWNLISGTFFSLLSFYVLRSPGHSQVYDVVIPYVFAALHVGMLLISQTQVERTGRTAAFYHNLPRDHGNTFTATTLFFLGHALYYQFVIALGVFFKLGGADITPVYRLHPAVMTMPFLAVIAALWYCYRPRNTMANIGSATAVLMVLATLVTRHLLKPAPSIENNFLPARDCPLLFEGGVALLLLALGTALCWRLKCTQPPAEGNGV